MKFLSELPTNKLAWLTLLLTAFGLELSALFFQYGLKLEPCIMCIYQRVALWAIFLAGLLGCIACQNTYSRILAYILWATGAFWGLLLAIEHVEIQQAANSPNAFLFSCDIIPNFPIWAPLHEWFPGLFAATGDCGEIAWQFLGYSMPVWMIVVYSLFSLAFIAVLLSRILLKKAL